MHEAGSSDGGSVQPMFRRIGWISADQAVSSITNLALAVVVARHVSVESFGIFSLIYASYLFAVEFARALVLEPFVITLSGNEERARRSASAALGASLALALAIALAVAAAAVAVPEQLSGPFLLLSVGVPGL